MTPEPMSPREPLSSEDRLLGGLGLVLVLAFVIYIGSQVFSINTETTPPTATAEPACIVNGLGNELCDAPALAYCQLLDDNGTLTAGSREACESIGG